ncbi:MAG: UbiH/UbiF/VisC/COQ6 family ubiquinone biosynthesis hydroxylase [Pseudomonadota bacterium]
MQERTDIAIIGGGMVGGMLACALGDSHYRVIVLEAGSQPSFAPTDDYSLRVSALSLASQRMLECTGAWAGVIDRRACPYRRMRVWDGTGSGQTDFDSGNIAETHLGHIVENHVLQLALYERAVEFENIEWRSGSRLENIDVSDESARVTLDSGGSFDAKLIVGADGARSLVRSLCGIEAVGSVYEKQHALVATVETDEGQQDITWQRFVPAGPQALLPLCGHRASIVWYNTPEEVARIKTLSDDEFIAEMQEAFPAELGDVNLIVGRGSFPLSYQHATHYVKPRIALIGDAAHSIHPLAGQGVNLGLLDAATLAEVLLGQKGKGDAGSLLALRRYERWRKTQNIAMQSLIDGIYKAFDAQQTPIKFARNALLNAANEISAINRLCMRYASGVDGDLPKLARGVPIL